MKKLSKNVKMYICMFVAVFCAMTLKAEAANVTSGTLGDNGGITWTYEADTKTLTITGEDSGLQGTETRYHGVMESQFKDICGDVKYINVKDCTIKGSAFAMFADLEYLESIKFSNVNTANVTDMSWMFYGCSSLSSLDLSKFNTSNVTDMSYMFLNCGKLSSLDIGSFNTSKVTDMDSMFQSCSVLNSVDVSNFNTSNVTNMDGMFFRCSGLSSLDVSNFNTSNVTNMNGMFFDCSGISSLDVSNFDTSNVTDMDYMFRNCSRLNSLDVSNFDTSNVTDMYGLFWKCSSLSSLDLSNFNASSVTEMGYMFYSCSNLAVIKTPKTMPETLSTDLPATYINSNGKRTTKLTKNYCNTTLINENFLVSEIKLDAASLTIDMGKTGQLNATVLPEKAINKTVTWESSNDDVATVDANGKVTAVAEGIAVITVTATDLPGVYVSASCEVTVTRAMSEQEKKVRAFVERMYTVALGRASESTGINYWTEELLAHRKDGASISAGFIMSKEFKEKNYSNEEYLKVLYRTFFDREADTGGMNFWLEQMKVGRSRKSVLAGFVNSKEFTEICESYGINRGTMEDDATATGAGQFVERLYSIALERPSDPSGLKDWADRINNRTNTPEQVAKEFFLSPEYTGKNTSNDKYVETLYLVFMDRASEAGGKAYWVEQLNNGVSRESVLEGFAQSEEFKEIMARYGL